MIAILWLILSAIGLLVAVWYISAILNPRGRINYPMILWKSSGHYISLIIIIVGIASLVGLYISISDSFLFLEILLGLFVMVSIIKAKFTPLRMSFKDVMGSLYSEGGLRFGGFQTSNFLEATEPLEKERPGIREKIIGEAHYLVFWLHKFPEIAFFGGIVFYKNFLVASLLFAVAFTIEIIRFYLFGSSLFLSYLCRFWDWIKTPIFVITAIILWSQWYFLSIILLIFLIIQGWIDLVASIGMLPIRLMAGRIIYLKYDGEWHNMEGMSLSFVINKWRLKLFPADKFNIVDKSK